VGKTHGDQDTDGLYYKAGPLQHTHRRGHELFLGSIELAPEAQRTGIGSSIIRSVLREASQRRVPVRLQVFRQNPARRLYQRLGFHVTGETPTHVEMVHD
jgi:ribosomal protein S18 acetylase RimI-like enzyme